MHPIIHFYWLDFSEFVFLSKKNSNGICKVDFKQAPINDRKALRCSSTVGKILQRRMSCTSLMAAAAYSPRIKNFVYTFPRKITRMCICIHKILEFSCILHIFLSSMKKYTIIKSIVDSFAAIYSRKAIFFVCFLRERLKTLKMISQKKTLYSILLQYFMSYSRWFCFSFNSRSSRV